MADSSKEVNFVHKLSILLIPLMSIAVLAACDSGPSAAEIEKMVETKVQTEVGRIPRSPRP